MLHVEVKPELFRWARERAGVERAALLARFPKLPAWESGDAQPTLRQVERFAAVTHTPVGYLFLAKPPEERLPLPDFRTMRSAELRRPSPNLLETLYVCEQRQEWYRQFARAVGEEVRPFVGCVSLTTAPENAAVMIAHQLGFGVDDRRQCATWEEALRRFLSRIDDAGILVMCSGVVLNNTHRPLDPEEFRGFAMADSLAPLIFVNSADTKAAQIFTLAHELAHLWLGQSGISNERMSEAAGADVERWCNEVAAELLVPLERLREELDAKRTVPEQLQPLARIFKVSTLVILMRLRDLGALAARAFNSAYEAELARLTSRPRSPGGSFFPTQVVRVGRRFARALVGSTLQGDTLYRDAMRMLGVSKPETVHELGRELGIGG